MVYIFALIIVLMLIIAIQQLKIRELRSFSSDLHVLFTKLESDKDMLLKETQHRVKNNMQVISSLLSLQDRNEVNESAKQALHISKNRVKSIALIHQRLYSEERLGHFSAPEYIESLSNSLFNAYKVDPERVRLRTEIEDLLIHIDTGIPVGLILNELLTNCLNHAFTQSEEGEVIIRLRELDKKLILEVEDSGSLLSPEELNLRVGSFGNKMIAAFGKKLNASLKLESKGANKVSLHISNYQVRI